MESTGSDVINIESKEDSLIKEIEHEIIAREEPETNTNLSLLELEEFLKAGKVPPGIKEYDDLPPLNPQAPSESKVEKKKKPWETDENTKNLNFLQNDEQIN